MDFSLLETSARNKYDHNMKKKMEGEGKRGKRACKLKSNLSSVFLLWLEEEEAFIDWSLSSYLERNFLRALTNTKVCLFHRISSRQLAHFGSTGMQLCSVAFSNLSITISLLHSFALDYTSTETNCLLMGSIILCRWHEKETWAGDRKMIYLPEGVHVCTQI